MASCVTSPAGSRAARGEANFLPRHTEVVLKTHRTAIAFAVRCVALCSALHLSSHRTAFFAPHWRVIRACPMPALGQSPSILIPEFSIQNQIAVGRIPRLPLILNSKFSIQNQIAVGHFPLFTPIPNSKFSIQNQIAVGRIPLFTPILNSKFSIQNQIAVGRIPLFAPILNSKFSIHNYTLLCCLVRRARVALRTASTVTPTSPKTASPMLPSPTAASSRMATFTPMAKMMF